MFPKNMYFIKMLYFPIVTLAQCKMYAPVCVNTDILVKGAMLVVQVLANMTAYRSYQFVAIINCYSFPNQWCLGVVIPLSSFVHLIALNSVNY
jgi:hypothetical protein